MLLFYRYTLLLFFSVAAECLRLLKNDIETHPDVSSRTLFSFGKNMSDCLRSLLLYDVAVMHLQQLLKLHTAAGTGGAPVAAADEAHEVGGASSVDSHVDLQTKSMTMFVNVFALLLDNLLKVLYV